MTVVARILVRQDVPTLGSSRTFEASALEKHEQYVSAVGTWTDRATVVCEYDWPWAQLVSVRRLRSEADGGES